MAFTELAFWFSIDNIALLACILFIADLYVAVQGAPESEVTAGMVSSDNIRD